MDYRVEELAARSGVGVDTIRYYQGKGILAPPRRSGRVALYDDSHLERLNRIRSLLREGLTLGLIARVLAREADDDHAVAPLAAALVAAQVGGERTLTRAELAAEAGVPEALVTAAQAAGLIEPLRIDGDERYGESDLRMARAGLALLAAGIPLNELLDLAVEHARVTQTVAERAIDLFDRHVRRRGRDDAPDAAVVTAAFRELLPEATRLVALFFQRTIVSRALGRLDQGDESSALRKAIAAAESSRLEVAWR